MFVHDLMTRRPTAVHQGTSVKEALVLLDRHHITSLPLVDGAGHVLGVVSEADLIRDQLAADPRAHLDEYDVPADRPATVSDVMTRQVVSVHPGADVQEAVELLTSTAVKSLPVVDDHGRLVGVFSRSDVVRVLARSDDELTAEVDSLMTALGHPDWLVEVTQGVVSVSGPTSPGDRALARAAAASVAGVVETQVNP